MENQRSRLRGFLFVLLFTAACLLRGDYQKTYAAEASVRLVYGDEELADKDAFVITILGEGYTSLELSKFEAKTKSIPDEFMSCSPWDELASVVKIYSVCVPSGESGCRGDHANSYEEMLADSRDTRYEAQYWYNGLERLLVINRYDRQREDIRKYKPETDFTVILVNSEKYGGSGGQVSVMADDGYISETMLHEAGHTVANLKDEYPYIPRECANVTQESDPEKVGWRDFIGKNGIGIYPYGNTTDWFIPSQSCKMQMLNMDFCEVCKEEIRKQVCFASNATVLYYQPYARENDSFDGKMDFCRNLVLRKGSEMMTGDEIEDKLTITYYDRNGNKLWRAPSGVGTYTAKVVFAGMEGFEACEQTFSFEIDHTYKVLTVTEEMYRAQCTDCGEKITKKPAAPQVSAASAGNKKLSFQTEIDDCFVTGMEIRYYVYGDYKNTLKKKYVRGHADRKVTLYGLTSGKNYVVMVRTYHKSEGGVTYSPWTTLKKIKVK